MHGKKILIVDDSRVDVRMLSLKLTANGYAVRHAEEGSSAVAIARSERPDLILLDISFPPDVAHGGGVPWDGFLILSWLQRLDEAKGIPVIFISGSDRAGTAARALKAGAVRYFQKPIDTKELLAAIEQETNAAGKSNQAKKRILFVDDEKEWRLMATSALGEAGFEVVTAQDLAEALQRLETPQLDGIVLDLNLNGENGLLLMQFLRQKHPSVPILIYTGYHHDDEAIQSMLQLGARKYLRKGTMQELSDALKTMVN